MSVLQREGVPASEVLAELAKRAGQDVDWGEGRVLSGIYDPGERALRLSMEAYSRFLTSNALYLNFFPSLGQMEREIVRSAADLLRGDAEVVGSFTSGGTESILMAVKAARDHARAERPEIREPEMVLPITAHPAFHKAAHYLGLEPVVTPVETKGFRADVDALKRAFTPNTILAVGSAPNFSHGTIDPIPEMAALARERDVLFHVDGCVGGFHLSFLRRLGEPLTDFDFSVEGVTSISADLHKYGYAPKNASVVLYRSRALRRHAFFVCSGTTEYAVINPTAQSTRSGGPIAAAWAVMRHLGEAGYQEIARATHEATRRMIAGIEGIDGVDVLADPEMCMFTMGSEALNVFELDDEMRTRGWSLLPQFACGGGPENLHVSVTWSNVPHVERFIEDLSQAVAALRAQGPSIDRAALSAEVSAVAGRPLPEIFEKLAPRLGVKSDGSLPERMAPLNTVLNLLPADVRDELLAVYLNLIT